MNSIRTILATSLAIQLMGCGNSASTKSEEIPVKVSTPVSVSAVQTIPIRELVNFVLQGLEAGGGHRNPFHDARYLILEKDAGPLRSAARIFITFR